MGRFCRVGMVILIASFLSTSPISNGASSTYAESNFAPSRTSRSTLAPSVTLADGSRIVEVCPQCGRLHARSSPASTAQVAPRAQVSPAGTASSRIARTVSSVLDILNTQRARQGLGSLRYDPVLQAVAERRAEQMAASGQKGHPPGSFAPGRYEGVGWSSSYSPTGVSACYTSDPRMQVAGAAMATGRDGVYFVVVYR